MNKRVLWTMIVLLWVFLIGFAIVKLLFGDWLVAVVENERILKIGSLIDGRWQIRILADTVISMIAMQFYLCSCKQVWRLPLYMYMILAGYTLILNIIYLWSAFVGFVIDLAAFILIPILMKAKISQTLCVLVLHHVGQITILFIRSEPMYLASTNYATQFVLLFDVYVWLVLYYLYSNLYKEETLWEKLGSPFSAIRRKMSSKKSS